MALETSVTLSGSRFKSSLQVFFCGFLFKMPDGFAMALDGFQ
jgi:hypothetical protein